jgi:hypothetical protein
MQIRRRGVKSRLDAKRFAVFSGSLETLLQVRDPDDFSRALLQVVKLLIHRCEVKVSHFLHHYKGLHFLQNQSCEMSGYAVQDFEIRLQQKYGCPISIASRIYTS